MKDKNILWQKNKEGIESANTFLKERKKNGKERKKKEKNEKRTIKRKR